MRWEPLSSVLLALIALSALQAEAAPSGLTADPAPGFYGRDLALALDGGGAEGRLYYRFAESGIERFSPYLGPLSLTALSGEERRYTLQVRRVSERLVREEAAFEYVVDRRAPEAPAVNLAPADYPARRQLSFTSAPGDSVYYNVGSGLSGEFTHWNGFSVELPLAAPGEKLVLRAHAQDRAGNRSPTRVWDFSRAAAAAEIKPFLNVVSPQPGKFRNRQMLVVQHAGWEWVRYSLDGSPPEQGRDYVAALELPAEGKLTLRVAAGAAGRIERRELSYEVAPAVEAALAAWPSERDPAKAFDLPVFGGAAADYAFCLEERSPQAFDRRLGAGLRLEVQAGAYKVLPVRIRDLRDAAGGEYRFVVPLDGRVPAEPKIEIEGRPPYSRGPLIRLSAAAGSEIRYSLDGSEPGPGSPRYEGPFTPELPDGSENGRVALAARAFFDAVRASPTAAAELAFDTLPPEKPSARIVDASSTGGAELVFDQAGELYYEIASGGGAAPEPGPGSPRAERSLVFSVPAGCRMAFSVKLARIDAAGNIARSDQAYRLVVNRVNPEPPFVSFRGDRLVLQAEGKIFYRIKERTAVTEWPAMNAFQEYGGEITLPDAAGKKAVFLLESYSQDEGGNGSEQIGPLALVLDRRIPLVPELTGVAEGALLNSEIVDIGLTDRESDLAVYYSVTNDGSEPSEPDTSSPAVEGNSLRIVTPDGGDYRYRFKFLALYPSSAEKGASRELAFTVDRVAPELPEFSGLPQGGRSASSVEIRLQAKADSDLVLYALAKAGRKPSRAEMSKYSKPLTMPGSDDAELGYSLYYGAEDPAGNLTMCEAPLEFTVDRKFPPAPTAAGISGNQVFTGPVELKLAAVEGRLFFTSTDDGSVPRIPDADAARLDGSLRLDGAPERRTVYNVYAVAVDEAGNTSAVLRLSDLVVDRRGQHEAVKPLVSLIGHGSPTVYSVSWPKRDDLAIKYRFEPGEEFKAAEAELILEVGPQGRGLEYYVEGRLAGRGALEKLQLAYVPALTPPRLSGITDGALVNKAVMIHREASDFIIRYELSILNQPRPVGRFSPEMPETITIDANEGETVSYIIQAQSFSRNGEQKSDIVSFSLTIDRTPPSPPTLAGVLTENYYQDDRSLSLTAEEGSIFYRLVSVDGLDDQFQDYRESFQPYTSALKAAIPENSYSTWLVRAYSLDQAGNRSRSVPFWRFYIDKKAVYVAADGDDLGEGTRTRPFRSLDKAFDYVSKNLRSAINLEQGEYVLSDSLPSVRDLEINGGFSRDWTRTDAKILSRLRLRQGLAKPVLSLTSGKTMALRRLGLEAADSNRPAIELVLGGLTLSSCELSTAGRARAIYQEGGRLDIAGTRISGRAMRSSELVQAKNGWLKVVDSVFSCDSADKDFTLLRAAYSRDIVISGSYFEGAAAPVSTLLHLVSAAAVLESLHLGTGQASLLSVGIKADDSEIKARNLAIATNPRSHINTAVSAVASELVLRDSNIQFDGVYGATGIYCVKGSFALEKVTVRAGTAGNFLYSFHASQSRGSLEGCSFSGGAAGDVLAALLVESTVSCARSSFALGAGGNMSRGVVIKGDGRYGFEANVFDDPAAKASAFSLDKEARAVSLVGNAFKRMGRLMESEEPEGGWSRLPTKRYIESVIQLNEYRRPGGDFRDNRSEN